MQPSSNDMSFLKVFTLWGVTDGKEFADFKLNGMSGTIARSFRNRADAACELGFNCVSMLAAWDALEPVPGRFDFENLDGAVNYTVAKGMIAKLVIGLTRGNERGILTDEDAMQDWEGRVISRWGRTLSFASPRYEDAMRFAAAVAVHYRDLIREGKVLVTIGTTNTFEFSYDHGYQGPDWYTPTGFPATVSDYSPHFLAAYRQWLEQRYGTVATMNRVWGTTYNLFCQVAPPAPTNRMYPWTAFMFTGEIGRDWYRFRDQQIRETFHRCLSRMTAEAGLAGTRYAIVDYGSLSDNQILTRGVANFVPQCDHPAVLGIKQNPALDYNFRWCAEQVMCGARRLGLRTAVCELEPTGFDNVHPETFNTEHLIHGFAETIRFGCGVSFHGFIMAVDETIMKGSPRHRLLEQVVAGLDRQGLWRLTTAPVPSLKPVDFRYPVSRLIVDGEGCGIQRDYEALCRSIGGGPVNVILEDDLTPAAS
jgi:hypothetical protein